jgi:large subunit ribosomal protein L4
VIDEFDISYPKTREIADRLHQLGLTNVLIITNDQVDNLELSVRNLKWAMVLEATSVNPVSLLQYDKVLVTVSGLQKLEERLQ